MVLTAKILTVIAVIASLFFHFVLNIGVYSNPGSYNWRAMLPIFISKNIAQILFTVGTPLFLVNKKAGWMLLVPPVIALIARLVIFSIENMNVHPEFVVYAVLKGICCCYYLVILLTTDVRSHFGIQTPELYITSLLTLISITAYYIH